MRPDISALETFYASRQGQLARRLIGHRLRQMWPDLHLRGRSVLGLGYAAPYLSAFDAAERAVALVPPACTVDAGRSPVGTAGGRVAVAVEDELPLADQSVDRVLLVHALESSKHPRRLLREVWRVLADGGRLIVVVPNRRGLWCLGDGTPFGHGQPYSSGQIARRLDGNLFEPRAERGALYLPPTESRVMLRFAVPAERLGLALVPQLAGVVLVEAEKRIYVGTPLPAADEEKATRRRRYVAVPRALVAARSRGTRPEHRDDLPRAA